MLVARPTRRVREPKRSSRRQREIPVLFKERYIVSAGADVDARAERPEGRKDWTRWRPPEPDPDNAGEGNPPRRSLSCPGARPGARSRPQLSPAARARSTAGPIALATASTSASVEV